MGKAREVYAALSLDQSSDYDTAKASILSSYEPVGAGGLSTKV